MLGLHVTCKENQGMVSDTCECQRKKKVEEDSGEANINMIKTVEMLLSNMKSGITTNISLKHYN